ncbi:MAG: ABC transporter ATP-binding protein [Methanomicrobiales archaeon]|nr:ABC transporter ATP-binding protein [Methanomicrobiales archaeon]
MIRVENLHRVYRLGKVEVPALRGVSFQIPPGQFVALMGPSGSGKSTLMNLVGLLDHPTSGTIAIGGRDVLGFSDDERTAFRLERYGFIFQDYALVSDLSALENVILPLLARGAGHEEARRRATEVMALVGLEGRLAHIPGELSGGEQQRVAIARALVNRPEILLADEPCANLDSTTSGLILELIRKINEDLGQTILMISHEEWHKSFADRIIRLKDGVIEKDVPVRREQADHPPHA